MLDNDDAILSDLQIQPSNPIPFFQLQTAKNPKQVPSVQPSTRKHKPLPNHRTQLCTQSRGCRADCKRTIALRSRAPGFHSMRRCNDSPGEEGGEKDGPSTWKTRSLLPSVPQINPPSNSHPRKPRHPNPTPTLISQIVQNKYPSPSLCQYLSPCEFFAGKTPSCMHPMSSDRNIPLSTTSSSYTHTTRPTAAQKSRRGFLPRDVYTDT